RTGQRQARRPYHLHRRVLLSWAGTAIAFPVRSLDRSVLPRMLAASGAVGPTVSPTSVVSESLHSRAASAATSASAACVPLRLRIAVWRGVASAASGQCCQQQAHQKEHPNLKPEHAFPLPYGE